MNRDVFLMSGMTFAGLFGILVGYQVGSAVMFLVSGVVGLGYIYVRDD